MTITRGGAGTGRPFVDVTNDNATVTYDVTSYTIGGTNNIHVVGTMRWVSSRGGSGTLPATTPWEISSIPLSVGMNIIRVTGTNVFGDSASDGVIITRTGIGTDTPFVDITNPFTKVEYNVTEFAVAGTNNIHVVGGMLVSNEMNGATADFPALQSWTAPSIELVFGPNRIVVYGTNYLNQTASDNVIITRCCIGTGTPYLDVTTTPTFVTYDVKELPVSGTNNVHVVGDMIVSNAANGAMGTFPAALGWETPPVNLENGMNEIFVYGYNLFEEEVSDSVVIMHGGIGTGEPFVDITNIPAFVTYDITEFAVAGTNNIHVMGGMLVSNVANGAVASFPAADSWTATSLTLDVGLNEIIVVGTNYLNKFSSDSVIITRGGIGTGEPYVDVTTTPTFVTYDITEFAVAGTNNIHVMGEMLVSNVANGAVASFPAADSWIATALPLDVGMNEIVVVGTNLLNISTSDSVIITRGGIGTGKPFVDVTTPDQIVVYGMLSIAVKGTNNIHVIGDMIVSNAANGDTHSFAASPNWTASGVDLIVGENVITVVGTNVYGEISSDSVSIKRLRVPATVDILEPNGGENYSLNSGPHVTNIVGVAGGVVTNMYWTNTLTHAGGLLPISANFDFPVQLEIGANEIIVVAEGDGSSASDSITISVGAYNNIPSNLVLCTWPESIGSDQTGTVEFVSTRDSVYTIFVLSNGIGGTVTQVLSSGTCAEDWNLVPFYSGDLPCQLDQGTNVLLAQIGNKKPIPAGKVIVVPDLGIGKENMTPDGDGDLIMVIYKSKTGGQINAKGRTLFITGGAAADKLIVKVKKTVKGTDRACRIAGIITDGGFVNLKIQGTLDKLLADKPVRKIMTKFGSLGHKCRTRLHNVRFDSLLGNSIIKIKFGDLNANVFSGQLDIDPEFNGVLSTNGSLPMTIDTRKGIKMINVKGGNVGFGKTKRWLDADYLRKIIVKPKRFDGGDIVDYAFLLTGEEKINKGFSIGKMMVAAIYDTSNSNKSTMSVCGYDSEIDPRTVDLWTNLPVKYTIGKIKVKGGPVEGMFILKKEPLKKKIIGVDDADWIIDGKLK